VAPDDDIDIALLTMTFRASDPDQLLSVLSKYVVMTRNQPGCRNADLCVSYAEPTRFVIIQKWDSEAVARDHFDAPVMVEMAAACVGVLSSPPDVDLLGGISAHDVA